MPTWAVGSRTHRCGPTAPGGSGFPVGFRVGATWGPAHGCPLRRAPILGPRDSRCLWSGLCVTRKGCGHPWAAAAPSTQGTTGFPSCTLLGIYSSLYHHLNVTSCESCHSGDCEFPPEGPQPLQNSWLHFAVQWPHTGLGGKTATSAPGAGLSTASEDALVPFSVVFPGCDLPPQ